MRRLKTIIKGLWSQKTRSLLTAIAIICATSIITCLIAFYNATTYQMAEEIALIQKNTKIFVQIHPSENQQARISYYDYQKTIKPKFKDRSVAAAKKSYTHIYLDSKKKQSSYFEHITCDYEYFHAHNLSLRTGRFFDAIEYSQNNFVVLGNDIAKSLQKAHPLEKELSLFIDKKNHHVLGILAKQDDKYFFGQNNINRTIYTHLKTTHASMLAIDEIAIQVQNPNECEQVTTKIEQILRDHFPKVRYEIIDMSKTAKQLQDHITKIKFVLIAFGLISTLIASVNITNSTYAIISERFQEIGIRLAIGATAQQVKGLLIAETVLLSSASAGIGIVIGELLNILLIMYLDWDYSWQAYAGPLTFIMMNIVSLLSCYIPLMKVDKINPIKAIQNIS